MLKHCPVGSALLRQDTFVDPITDAPAFKNPPLFE